MTCGARLDRFEHEHEHEHDSDFRCQERMRRRRVCKRQLLGGTLARYEQLPISRRDPPVWDFDSPLENRRVNRHPRFRPPVRHSMDRVGTRAEKCDSFRLLGMQRDREPADAQLFCDLPARFRGRVEYRDAFADLLAKSLFPLHPPRAPTSRQCAATAAVSRALRGWFRRLNWTLP